jgi:hypothetical protein
MFKDREHSPEKRAVSLTTDLLLWGRFPPQSVLYSDTPLSFLYPSDKLRLFLSQNFTCINSLAVSSRLFFLLSPPVKMEQIVPKRRKIEFRRRETTQNKEYNIINFFAECRFI